MAFKPQIGHTLGATAALETTLLLSALKQGGSSDYQGRKICFSECAASQKGGFFCLANQFGFGRQQHIFGMAMATVNPNIRITAAVRFDTDAGTGGKILKQTLKQQSSIDTRRLSRLSLIAALGAGQLKEQCEIRSDCAVFLGTPFSSPSVFEKMADNVLNHHAAMPFDFIANLHNSPRFSCRASVRHAWCNFGCYCRQQHRYPAFIHCCWRCNLCKMADRLRVGWAYGTSSQSVPDTYEGILDVA